MKRTFCVLAVVLLISVGVSYAEEGAAMEPVTESVSDKMPAEKGGSYGSSLEGTGAGSAETVAEIKNRMGWDTVWSSEPAENKFVGVRKCLLCHKKDAVGNQYGIWQTTPHAKAYETLGTPEAKALGAKLGIEDPQQSGKCLRCHSTAYYFGEERLTNTIPVEEGISCESCHGPGKKYMKKSVMKDRNKAIAAGLLISDEQTCLKCHNETAPNIKPFNYEHSFDLIKHPVPYK